MKKLLLASSALVLTAGYAAAEVTVNGDGYFGVIYAEPDGVYTNGQDGDDTNWAFVYDLDFQFVGTGETDGGLIFGASVDADDAAGAQGTQGFEGEIFIQGDFGKLSMGDVDGGAEAIIGDLAGVGLTGLGDFNENIFLLSAGDPNECNEIEDTFESAFVEGVDENGDPVTVEIEDAIFVNAGSDNTGCGSGPLALYEYSNSGFTVALGLNDDEGYSAGLGYATDMWSLGIAYEYILEGGQITVFDTDFPQGDLIATPDDDTHHVIGAASVTAFDTTFKATYGYLDAGSTEVDQWGLSATTSFDLWTFSAYYRQIDPDADGVDSSQFYGIGGEYDLGGGAAIVAGIIYADVDVGNDDFDDEGVFADFGLSFSF
ncbi:MAG: porin [Pseudomonadota bacterium]